MLNFQGFSIFEKHVFKFQDIIFSQLVIREVQIMQSLIVAKGIYKEDDFQLIEIAPSNRKMIQNFVTHDRFDENW